MCLCRIRKSTQGMRASSTRELLQRAITVSIVEIDAAEEETDTQKCWRVCDDCATRHLRRQSKIDGQHGRVNSTAKIFCLARAPETRTRWVPRCTPEWAHRRQTPCPMIFRHIHSAPLHPLQLADIKLELPQLIAQPPRTSTTLCRHDFTTRAVLG